MLMLMQLVRAIMVLITLAALLVGTSSALVAHAVQQPRDPHDRAVYVVEVPTDATVTDVAADLQRYGLITHPALFRWMAHMQHTERIAPGTYRFRKTMTMREIVTMLHADPTVATGAPPPQPAVTP